MTGHLQCTCKVRMIVGMNQASPRMPDGHVVKRATNVSLAEPLIEEARALGINISQACERGLRDEVQQRRRQRWLEENDAAIAAYNKRIAKDGLTLAKYRRF